MHALADRLLKTIRKQELLRPGDRVAVAVSGGADSVALLSLLLELRSEVGFVLSVAHVNHKLRGPESDEDEQFVAALAQQRGLELYLKQAPRGDATKSGIEAAARKFRYDFFRQIARENRIAKIATAHSLDDQAETVLLRIMRGTGIRGLGGIHPRLVLEDAGCSVEVIRPLLAFRHAELEAFLRERNQPWREDSSNRNLAFTRNRVRHNVLPLLQETFGAAAVENLVDLAEIARSEEEHWKIGHAEIRADGNSVDICALRSLPIASQRRLIRTWLEANAPEVPISFRLIEEVLELACAKGKRLALPGGHGVTHTQNELRLEQGDEHSDEDYEYKLTVPGYIDVRKLGIRFEAVVLDIKHVDPARSEQLLDPARLPRQLTVRNWRPGDRFWPAHTKEAKKMKELLSDRRVSGKEKKLWPVVEAEGLGLVWARGFAIPANLRPNPDARNALLIREAKTP